jgi:hypothetical protein
MLIAIKKKVKKVQNKNKNWRKRKEKKKELKKKIPSQCHCEAPHRISIECNIVWALIKMCSENNMFKKSAQI